MTAQAFFPRRIDALSAIFEFTAGFWRQAGVAAELRPTVDFVLEELFTNVVKYGGGTAPVGVTLRVIKGGVEAVVEDPDAKRFDPTHAPDADTTLPADKREPGGLGLHLIKRLVDSIDYRYSPTERHSWVTIRKTQATPATGGTEGEHDAGD